MNDAYLAIPAAIIGIMILMSFTLLLTIILFDLVGDGKTPVLFVLIFSIVILSYQARWMNLWLNLGSAYITIGLFWAAYRVAVFKPISTIFDFSGNEISLWIFCWPGNMLYYWWNKTNTKLGI